MEATAVLLMSIGVLGVLMSLLLGAIELATLGTIHPPKRQTFTYIRLTAAQNQTVALPTLGALFSGLFISLSASFFYGSFTGQQNSWHQWAGLVSFSIGAVLAVATLWSVIKGVGDPVELARDPFSIRAAAEESAAAPRRGGLDPQILTQQLDGWTASISGYAMNLSGKVTSTRLNESLAQASQTHKFWISSVHSLQVYYAAFLRFPFRFGWPVLSFALLMTGTVWYAIGVAELNFATSWRPWIVLGRFAIIGAVATLFYCATRGNRARLWHRINLVALKDARNAIVQATVAHASVADENALMQRVLANADKFLQQDDVAPGNADRTVLRFGKFRLSMVDHSRRT